MGGRPTASEDLLALAHGNLTRFATGSIPPWVYPVWMVLASSIVLVVALYLAYRGATSALLVAAGFPPSFIPLMLLGAGLVVDGAARGRWRSLTTAARCCSPSTAVRRCLVAVR